MKMATHNGKRIGFSKTAKDCKFAGCALSIDHKTLPVGLEFVEGDGFIAGDGRTGVAVFMTIEEAERVHRALGEMIAKRKSQGHR